jgi:hypothetical protein
MRGELQVHFAMMRGTKTGHFVNSARRGLTLYWLAQMSKDSQDQWGASKLTDADVMGLADQMKLPGTGPWIKGNA